MSKECKNHEIMESLHDMRIRKINFCMGINDLFEITAGCRKKLGEEKNIM